MQLSKIIDERLLPVIKKNTKTYECIYLDLPYHTNIGDTLIWHGTEHFLKRAGLKCLYKTSFLVYSENTMKKIIKRSNAPPYKKTLIFLHGGGNFGDLWEIHHNFKKEIIKNYLDNPIIILPQTVSYSDVNKIKTDSKLFAQHKNLTICARDKRSYQILKNNFQNEIVLVPDMAFCIPLNELKYFRVKQENKTLLLKRNDIELNNTIDYLKFIPEKEIDIRDWPSIEKRMISSYFMEKIFVLNRKASNQFSHFTDIYASYFYKRSLIKAGVKFISKYNKIYTTRLHGAILSFLLEKPCILLDNSYGKNSTFFETWLSDSDVIQFFHSPSS